MPKAWPILTNFTAGEFSPKLDGRVDISRYLNAAQIIENFIIEPYGGVIRRPGSIFIAQAKHADKKFRTIPFRFSRSVSYMIEAGEGYMRFYRNLAPIVEAATTITGATAADPVVITSTAHGYANGDTVRIAGVVGMTELNGKRFLVANVAANTYELQDLFGTDIDGTAFTAYTSGGTAEKIYEITTPFVESDLFELQFAQKSDIMYLTHGDHPTQKLSRFGDTSWSMADVVFTPMPFQPINPDEALTVTPSATSGAITLTASSPLFTADDVGTHFRIGGKTGSPSRQGYVEITGFTSTTVVSGTVGHLLDGITATDDWAFGSYGITPGYPSCVTFHEQRLFLGGTSAEPQTIKGSETLDFESYNPGADDTDALDYEIVTEQLNEISWLSSGRDLGVGTAGGAFILSSGSVTTPLTPSNVQVARQSNFGSRLAQPQIIDTFTYYIQRNGRRVREFAYSFEIDRHKSVDMTLLAEHITKTGLVQMDYQQSPQSVIWAVRADGQLATMTRQIDQEVTGWSRQIAGATLAGACPYESVGVIPGDEEDEIWVAVQRNVNSVVRRNIEVLAPQDFGSDQEDVFFLDSGLTYDGPAVTTFTGLDHLEGETVQILSEGAVVPDATVTNGSITLDKASTKVHIGLGYVSELESMRLEAGAGAGTAQGKIGRIYEVVFRFYESLGAKFGVREKLDILPFRNTNDAMDAPPPLFSGDKRVGFPKGYQRGTRVYIKQDQPLPLTLLAIMPKLETFDR